MKLGKLHTPESSTGEASGKGGIYHLRSKESSKSCPSYHRPCLRRGSHSRRHHRNLGRGRCCRLDRVDGSYARLRPHRPHRNSADCRRMGLRFLETHVDSSFAVCRNLLRRVSGSGPGEEQQDHSRMARDVAVGGNDLVQRGCSGPAGQSCLRQIN